MSVCIHILFYYIHNFKVIILSEKVVYIILLYIIVLHIYIISHVLRCLGK